MRYIIVSESNQWLAVTFDDVDAEGLQSYIDDIRADKDNADVGALYAYPLAGEPIMFE